MSYTRVSQKLVLVVMLALCLASCRGGQTKHADAGRGPSPLRYSVDPGSLVGAIRSAPPELAADALIRLAESSAAIPAAEKVELLERAFDLAAHAQQPFRRSLISGNADSPNGYLSDAFDLQLDALSLRCRAARAMAALDKRRAREMFNRISPRLALAPLGCEDDLQYEVSVLYTTLAVIARTTFDDGATGDAERAALVARYAGGATSPAQLGPLAKTITSLDLPPDQLAALVNALAEAVSRVAVDNKSFAATILKGSALPQFDALLEMCRAKGVAADTILDALRNYLATNLGAGQCYERRILLEGQRGGSPPINNFCEKWFAARMDAGGPDAAAQDGHAKPQYWTTPEAEDLLMRVKRLRFGSGKKRLKADDKQTVEWQSELAGFYARLMAWEPRAERSKADYFHQKSSLLLATIELLPDRQMQVSTINAHVQLLSAGYALPANRIEWVWHARRLTDQANKCGLLWEALTAMRNSERAELRLHADVEAALRSSVTNG